MAQARAQAAASVAWLARCLAQSAAYSARVALRALAAASSQTGPAVAALLASAATVCISHSWSERICEDPCLTRGTATPGVLLIGTKASATTLFQERAISSMACCTWSEMVKAVPGSIV